VKDLLHASGDVTDRMFSVDETGANAGDVRIVSAADRESISSFAISIRVKAQGKTDYAL
jgi:Na+/citrate or Na+/malate symporter